MVTAYVQACLAHAKTDAQKAARTVEEWDARWNALNAELAPTRPTQPSTMAPTLTGQPFHGDTRYSRCRQGGDHPERPTPKARGHFVSDRAGGTLRAVGRSGDELVRGTRCGAEDEPGELLGADDLVAVRFGQSGEKAGQGLWACGLAAVGADRLPLRRSPR